MDAKLLLIDSLQNRWGKYQTELKTCRREFSEEAVHDLRVAARRLLSSLNFLYAVMQDPRVRKVQRVLKGQLDHLDDLRDVQVLLSDIAGNIHEAPHLKPFKEYLQRREKKLMRTARKEIKALKTADLSRRIRKLYKIVEIFTQAGLNVGLLSAVDRAYAIVMQRYGLVDPAQPATIHRVRLAFKKFRYMVEVVCPIVEDFPSDLIKRMHDYQSLMGDVQDMETAFRELTAFDGHAPAGYVPAPLHFYYKERHALAVSCYIRGKGEVVTFWRSTPDQPFPKEK